MSEQAGTGCTEVWKY